MRLLTLPVSGTVDLDQRVRRQSLLEPEAGDEAEQQEPGLHDAPIMRYADFSSSNLPRTQEVERSVQGRALFSYFRMPIPR